MADAPNRNPDIVTRSISNDYAQSSKLEWLQTNHTGAFAMGTVAGVNTRRYHGLLIASLKPPSDRYSILSRVEETVEIGENSYNLATVQYPGAVTPTGYKFIEEFSSAPSPTWRYRLDSVSIEKSIRLVHHEQTVVISYRANMACKIHIRFFLSFRDYHSLANQNSSFNGRVDQQQGYLTLRPYEQLPSLAIHHGTATFQADGIWFKDHEYLAELERGLDYREDLYSPGILHFEITPDAPVNLVATLESATPNVDRPIESFRNPLMRALDQFRVARADGRPTLIAGYPWFTDWSRDTLISLPALVTAGFDPAETKAILGFLLAERKQGILPNRFSDRSEPEYNTVDASLWFFIAAQAYIDATKDYVFLADTLFPAAIDIIDWHRRGTFYGIQVDGADHLLSAGNAETQLTWMDAKIGDYVVTPRAGKPVEINALWFNALQIASGWASVLSQADVAEQLRGGAQQVQSSFTEKFWNSELGYLNDVVTEEGTDSSLRPNQLFAISLPHPLLDAQKAQSVIREIRKSLLTAFGLRTLAPSDSKYCAHFKGDMKSRDSAYHQGTVWPWLIGPYVNACLYAFNNSKVAKDHCRYILSSMNLMNNYCLGSIGEVYDGDSPHNPGGCPAQLWSVAQMVLALRRIAES